MKTPIPAIDDARLQSSRRQLLRGLAISPVAIAADAGTGLAITRAQAAGAASNLNRLLDMERRLKEIEAALPDAYDAEHRTRALFNRQALPEPEPIYSFTPTTTRQAFYYKRRMARWRASQAKIEEATGYRAARDRLAGLREARDHITMGEVWDVQATDVASLKCKARMAQGGMSASLTADVLAMEG